MPPEPPAALLRDYRPVVAAALARRGIVEPAQARAFLAREAGDDNPFRLAGMDQAVTRLRTALHGGERIAVYGDYDADGVTATALLVDVLRALDGDVLPFIPHRERDGYGVHAAALTTLAKRGVGLVVTVDCGIRAGDEIEGARLQGLDVIVTDHHSLPDDLPGAVAVVNPKRADCRYGYTDLAGVGMAYKLAQGLLRVEGSTSNRTIPDEADLLDLVALGTVADVVPLLGENRALVHAGVTVLQAAHRPGVRALLDAAKLAPADVTSRTIAWVLGPRINAAGRMADAETALQVLLADEPARAAVLAAELEERNAVRRAATDVATEQAEREIASDVEAGEPLLWWASSDVALGVVGLVAGRLSRDHYRPAVAMHVDGEEARASLRSIDEVDLMAALEACADLLDRWGGHARAAGFTARKEHLPAIRARLSEHVGRTLDGHDLRPRLDIDAVVNARRIDWALHELLESLAPFGEGNPRPLLLARNVPVLQKKTVGDGRHLRLTVGAGPTGRMSAIGFGMGDRASVLGDRLDVVFGLKVNTWRGESSLEMQLHDLCEPEMP